MAGNIDSLKQLLKNTASDSTKTWILYEIARTFRVAGDDSTAASYAWQAMGLAKKRNDKTAMAAINLNIGIIHYNKGEFEISNKYFVNCVKLAEEVNDIYWMARAYTMIGEISRRLGNVEKAKGYFEKSLPLFEKVNATRDIAWAYIDLANVHSHDKDKRVIFYLKAAKIAKEAGESLPLSDAYHNLAGIYSADKNYDKALQYYLLGLEVEEKNNLAYELTGTYGHVAEVYLKKGKISVAESYLKKAKELAEKYHSLQALQFVNKTFALIRADQGRYREAYKYYLEYDKIDSMIFNEKKSEQILEMESKYESEKNKLTIENLEKEQKLQNAELKQKNFQRNAVIGGLLLIIIFTGFLFNRFRVTRNQKRVIEEQKLLVDKAHGVLKEKNEDILSSIRYAKRIQTAILPSLTEFYNHLPDSCILYKPKDIVSGDFYWLEKIGNQIFFAVADCTGHGVPGAMVSVICSNALSKAVKELNITEPAKVLDKVSGILKNRFEKSEEDVKDGMDIALCRLQLSESSKLSESYTVTLQYAGANNPLYIISNSRSQISSSKESYQNLKFETRNLKFFEIKANKQPIGKFENPQPFTNHEIELKKEDVIWIFSDGYPDQFGGPKGKKFKYKPFKKLLLSIYNQPMIRQKEILDETFEDWRGELEQVDDVCLIGVRV